MSLSFISKRLGDDREKVIIDCLFLTTTVIFSFILYFSKLGFYSDDWAFLAIFTGSSNQSFLELNRSFLFPFDGTNNLARPVQGAYAVALFKLFGLNPFGYHLTNGAVLIAIPIMFYIIMRYINMPRLIALTFSLLYIFLPNYSTNRFWFAAFQINLSLLFYLISLYAGLAFSFGKTKKIIWASLSLIGLLVSVMSYEVLIPFFFLNSLLFLYPNYKLFPIAKKVTVKFRERVLFVITASFLLVASIIYKFLITDRFNNGPLEDLSYHYAGYLWYIIKTAIILNYYELIMKMPLYLWVIFSKSFDITVLTVAVFLSIYIFYYLYSVTKQSGMMHSIYYIRLILLSIVLFIFGYLIFFINNNIDFTATGIGNRINFAATIGVALSILGGVGWACSNFLSERLSRIVFCGLITGVCFSGFIIINSLATFWTSSYKQEKEIIDLLPSETASIASDSTLILDGVCPYFYQAIVFESSWDLKGALKIIYPKKDLKADVVKRSLKVKDEGIYTRIYQQTAFYPYKDLYIYNFTERKLVPINTLNQAKDYFANSNSTNLRICPSGQDGHGVEYF